MRVAFPSYQLAYLSPYQQLLSDWVTKQILSSWFQTFAVFWMLYASFWVIPLRLSYNAGQLPRRKHTTNYVFMKQIFISQDWECLFVRNFIFQPPPLPRNLRMSWLCLLTHVAEITTTTTLTKSSLVHSNCVRLSYCKCRSSNSLDSALMYSKPSYYAINSFREIIA